MDLKKFWVIVVFVVCYEQSSVVANNVNGLNENRPGRSRPKKSVDADIYLAFPPDTAKAGKQDGPPKLIKLDASGGPNKFKGKFPTPIERFIQRIQNYFSVYNPPEYLNDLRPGINNPENDADQRPNDTQIVLPCNGTSTIVIIPVPLESENVSFEQNYTAKPEAYEVLPSTTTTAYKPNYVEAATTPKPNCAEITAPTEEPTTTKPKCPEPTTPKPDCAEPTTPKPKCPEPTTPKPKCPEVTTPKPDCAEPTTPKPKCPEPTTPKPDCAEPTTPKPKCSEPTTPKPKCPEVTTPKLDCAEPTTPKPKCPEPTTPKPKCPEAITTQKPPCPVKQNPSMADAKPISGYGPTEVPPINLVAQPIGSTVLYFYKQPSTHPTNQPPSYYLPSTPSTYYEEHSRRPQPPIMRLKQLLFPRLYAAFHPDD